jgi:4-coumarate--CoA ligase
MPIRSRFSVPLPLFSIPTQIFGSVDGTLPDKLAFADCEAPDTLRLTLNDYREWSKRLAAGLIQTGLQDGDRVLLHSGNSIFTPVVVMGVIMAGGIISMANPMFVPRELAYQLRDSGARLLLTATNLVECAKEAASLASLDEDRVYLFDDAPLAAPNGPLSTSQRHWSRLLADPAEGARFRWEEFSTETQANRTASLFYSSGTTGVPKGVEVTHRNLVANNCQIIYQQSLDPRFRQLDEAGEARAICPLPMYHGLGLIVCTLISPGRHVPVYVMRRYDGKKMVQYIDHFKVTELLLVPPILRWMAKDPYVRRGAVDLSSVRRVNCGAAPLSATATKEFESLWKNGQVNVKQAWGMSE